MSIRYASPIDLGGNKITGVAAPVTGGDVATKDYVDATVRGLQWKPSVRAASQNNHNVAAPGGTVDGVPLNQGNRVLLRAQTNPAENGIYVFDTSATALVRATDAATSAQVQPGMAVSVQEGSQSGDKTYILTTNGAVTLGTTALTFSSLGGLSYTAGYGIQLTGTGGTTIGVDPSILTHKASANVGDGTSTSIAVTHNLGSRDVIVQVYNAGAPYETVTCGVQRTDANTVTLVFSQAPAANAYRVVIVA